MESQLFDMFITFKAIENEQRQAKEASRKVSAGRHR